MFGLGLILRFLATPLGRWVAIGLAVALAVGCFYLWAYHRGAAVTLAAAAAASAATIARANKARAAVKDTPEAINADPANRDRR